MNIAGWYYLHTNGDLIYKRELGGTAADIRESDLAVAMWPIDMDGGRAGAWTVLVEGLCAGADKARIDELAAKWRCDNADADVYADHVGVTLELDGNQWCAHSTNFINLQESPAGLGDTKLEAMAALCKELGYKPAKMWGSSFAQLLGSQ